MVTLAPHSQGLPRGGQPQQPDRALGFRRRHDVPDEGRRRRRGLSPAGRRLRVPRPPRAPGRSRIASSRRCGNSTSRSASISTLIKRPAPAVSRRAASASGRPRGAAAPDARTSPAKADALFELELYLVVLYEGWQPRADDGRSARRRSSRSPARRIREQLSSDAAPRRVSADELDRAVRPSASEGGASRSTRRHRAARRCSRRARRSGSFGGS